ncbi:hypothetical protein K1719_037948 [Acacia pycnantha]|nr:hypothetical protein K1719_037948 [Acacia pycnantha]
MLLTSFSVISSSSSFPSISNLDSPSTPSPIRNRTVYSSRRCLKFTRPPFQFSSLHAYRPFSLIVRASSSKQVIEEGSVDKFLQNASMADFLRFKQGIDGGSGELQTAIVSYRKKFPWSLLYHFLQVRTETFPLLNDGINSTGRILQSIQAQKRKFSVFMSKTHHSQGRSPIRFWDCPVQQHVTGLREEEATP